MFFFPASMQKAQYDMYDTGGKDKVDLGKPIYGFYEDQYPIYSHKWTSELQSPVTVAELTELIESVKKRDVLLATLFTLKDAYLKRALMAEADTRYWRDVAIKSALTDTA